MWQVCLVALLVDELRGGCMIYQLTVGWYPVESMWEVATMTAPLPLLHGVTQMMGTSFGDP